MRAMASNASHSRRGKLWKWGSERGKMRSSLIFHHCVSIVSGGLIVFFDLYKDEYIAKIALVFPLFAILEPNVFVQLILYRVLCNCSSATSSEVTLKAEFVVESRGDMEMKINSEASVRERHHMPGLISMWHFGFQLASSILYFITRILVDAVLLFLVGSYITEPDKRRNKGNNIRNRRQKA